MQMFLLRFGQLARVMTFAGVEDEEQTDERDERKQTKHARGE